MVQGVMYFLLNLYLQMFIKNVTYGIQLISTITSQKHNSLLTRGGVVLQQFEFIKVCMGGNGFNIIAELSTSMPRCLFLFSSHFSAQSKSFYVSELCNTTPVYARKESCFH